MVRKVRGRGLCINCDNERGYYCQYACQKRVKKRICFFLWWTHTVWRIGIIFQTPLYEHLRMLRALTFHVFVFSALSTNLKTLRVSIVSIFESRVTFSIVKTEIISTRSCVFTDIGYHMLMPHSWNVDHILFRNGIQIRLNGSRSVPALNRRRRISQNFWCFSGLRTSTANRISVCSIRENN